MGHVWLARDEGSGLDVALKIVPREGKSGHRAEREARAAASLRHPRCQRIIALARDPAHVYIAYEYIPGRTLREAIRSGALDDAGAVEVAAQIAEALAHAHGRGIVHRDVKPSNVLLAEAGGIDVRLLDFGLAQMAEFDTLTGLGDIPGTLAYISPERLHGETATPAADIWAVGVLLWEALAGEHPFWGGDLTETSRRIQQGAPPLESLRPDLPRHVLDTVASALGASPQRRPTAASLAEELRSLAEAAPPEEHQAAAAAADEARAPERAAASRGADRARSRLGLGDAAVLSAELAGGPRRPRRRRRRGRAPRGSPVRADGGVLPAREHLARSRGGLRSARGGLDDPQLARRSNRAPAGARAAARTPRRPDARPDRRAARPRTGAPRAARRDGDPARRGGRRPAARAASLRRLGRHRSVSGSPAPTVRAPSHTHSQPSSAPIRHWSPRPWSWRSQQPPSLTFAGRARGRQRGLPRCCSLPRPCSHRAPPCCRL